MTPEEDSENKMTEAPLKIRGAMIPDGCGRTAIAEKILIGDGAPPVILIRFGVDEHGATVAEVTAGGFEDSGSDEANIRATGSVLAMVASVMETGDTIR